MSARLIKEDDLLEVPNYGFVNLYYTLKPTRYSLYIPYLSIVVEDHIVDAIISYLSHQRYAGLDLEEYLRLLHG